MNLESIARTVFWPDPSSDSLYKVLLDMELRESLVRVKAGDLLIGRAPPNCPDGEAGSGRRSLPRID